MGATPKRFAEICFFAFLALVTFVLTEAAYRVFLHQTLHTGTQQPDAAPTFTAWAFPAPWKFDRDLGFTFNDGQWRRALFADGAFTGCDTSLGGNRYGNFSPIRGDYASADVKVLFFGSSYTLKDVGSQGNTATNLLQEALSAEMGKKVHILNYSRDSIGILSMVDMARARLPIDKPDLIIFGFNTLSLAYQRNWRFVKQTGPSAYRMYQSLAATDEVVPQQAILAPLVISDKVTAEWCDRLERIRDGSGDKSALRGDPVVVELVRHYNGVRRDQEARDIVVDFFTPWTSFVYNKLRRGDAFYGMQVYGPKTIWAAISASSYAGDRQFVEAVAALKSSGVPLRLLHLPSLADLEKPGTIVEGVSSLQPGQERSLIRSLEQVFGLEYVPLSRYYAAEDLEKPLELVESKQDWHPNQKGTEAMARAFLRYFKENPFW
ncbi:MAG: hypothetical protein JNM30_20105 [Rhodospirillales bacterium]|nr:hypothetical protein [Rhodospirillales bacterium]